MTRPEQTIYYRDANKALLQGLWCKKYALELLLTAAESEHGKERGMRESAVMYGKALRALLAALDDCGADEAIQALAELGDLYSIERLESYDLKRALFCYCASYSLSKKREQRLGIPANSLYYYNILYNLKELCGGAVTEEEFEAWMDYFGKKNHTLRGIKAYLQQPDNG